MRTLPDPGPVDLHGLLHINTPSARRDTARGGDNPEQVLDGPAMLGDQHGAQAILSPDVVVERPNSERIVHQT